MEFVRYVKLPKVYITRNEEGQSILPSQNTSMRLLERTLRFKADALGQETPQAVFDKNPEGKSFQSAVLEALGEVGQLKLKMT